MKQHKLKAVWAGDHFLPLIHFARLAESSFTSSRVYDLIVKEEMDNKAAIRTREQNDKMWALLTEISEQVEHCNKFYSPDEWKVLMMHAMGQDLKLLPALNGNGVVQYGGRSSHMTIAQMNELIEFIIAWGTQRGVRFAQDKGVTWNE